MEYSSEEVALGGIRVKAWDAEFCQAEIAKVGHLDIIFALGRSQTAAFQAVLGLGAGLDSRGPSVQAPAEAKDKDAPAEAAKDASTEEVVDEK